MVLTKTMILFYLEIATKLSNKKTMDFSNMTSQSTHLTCSSFRCQNPQDQTRGAHGKTRSLVSQVLDCYLGSKCGGLRTKSSQTQSVLIPHSCKTGFMSIQSMASCYTTLLLISISMCHTEVSIMLLCFTKPKPLSHLLVGMKKALPTIKKENNQQLRSLKTETSRQVFLYSAPEEKRKEKYPVKYTQLRMGCRKIPHS